MLEIDGSHGEGGGQILRTSLSLSLITGTPFRMVSIRSKRAWPGLRRQHLTAVRAAAEICGARITGDRVSSPELSFEPGPVRSGDYEFDVGSAGSTTLVFQTVFPALLTSARGPSRVTFTGGTHNHGGPPWHFLERVFLPVMRTMGAEVNIQLERYGFAPAGGGRWTAEIFPNALRPVVLDERGPTSAREAVAVVSNLPLSIADRELGIVRERLRWADGELRAEAVPSDGPGNITMLSGQCCPAHSATIFVRWQPGSDSEEFRLRPWRKPLWIAG